MELLIALALLIILKEAILFVWPKGGSRTSNPTRLFALEHECLEPRTREEWGHGPECRQMPCYPPSPPRGPAPEMPGPLTRPPVRRSFLHEDITVWERQDALRTVALNMKMSDEKLKDRVMRRMLENEKLKDRVSPRAAESRAAWMRRMLENDINNI